MLPAAELGHERDAVNSSSMSAYPHTRSDASLPQGAHEETVRHPVRKRSDLQWTMPWLVKDEALQRVSSDFPVNCLDCTCSLSRGQRGADPVRQPRNRGVV